MVLWGAGRRLCSLVLPTTRLGAGSFLCCCYWLILIVQEADLFFVATFSIAVEVQHVLRRVVSVVNKRMTMKIVDAFCGVANVVPPDGALLPAPPPLDLDSPSYEFLTRREWLLLVVVLLFLVLLFLLLALVLLRVVGFLVGDELNKPKTVTATLASLDRLS